MRVLSRRRFLQALSVLTAGTVLAAGNSAGAVPTAWKPTADRLPLMMDQSLLDDDERSAFERRALGAGMDVCWLTLNDAMRLCQAFAHFDRIARPGMVSRPVAALIARPAMAFALRAQIEPRWRVLLSAQTRQAQGIAQHRLIGSDTLVQQCREGACVWRSVTGLARDLRRLAASSHRASMAADRREVHVRSAAWRGGDVAAWLAVGPRRLS